MVMRSRDARGPAVERAGLARVDQSPIEKPQQRRSARAVRDGETAAQQQGREDQVMPQCEAEMKGEGEWRGVVAGRRPERRSSRRSSDSVIRWALFGQTSLIALYASSDSHYSKADG